MEKLIDMHTQTKYPNGELSSKVDNGTMHVLGYNIDINNDALNKKLIILKDNSINAIISILNQKNQTIYKFDFFDVI